MRALAVLGCSVLLVAGCGGTSNTGDGGVTPKQDMAMAAGDMAMGMPDMAMATPDMAGAMMVNVGTGGNQFAPAMVTIPVGGTVVWTWGSSGHNVVSGVAAADNKFCSPNDMNCAAPPLSAAGFVYSHTFAVAGTYPYFCKPHLGAGMKGTVVVQ